MEDIGYRARVNYARAHGHTWGVDLRLGTMELDFELQVQFLNQVHFPWRFLEP